MKKLFLLIFASLCLSACAASSRVTMTLTITNTPAYPNTFVPNAKTITWTNSTAGAPSTSVLIGANIGASATNLFRQLSSYPLTGPVTLGFSSSNIITIKGAIGEAMAATMAGTWASLSYSTSVVTELIAVRVPMTGEPTQSTATNVASLIVTNISNLSTNALQMNAGIILPYIAGKTNQLIIGGAAIAPNSIGAPCLFSWVTGGPWESGDDAEILNMFSAKLNFPILNDAVTNSWLSTNFFGYITATGATIQNANLTSGGGTNLSFTNITLKATNYSAGIFGHTRANNTSLANGNNATIDFGTTVYVKLKAGPTAAFAICGIAGGADGRMLIIDNSIAQNMTIANDSGVEPTAANRIYTRTGADVTTTGQGVVTLIYDSEDSRWVLVSAQL